MKNNGLYRTTDYSIFEMHPCNRDLTEKPELEASIRKHGFTISNAIHCKPNGNGKLKVLRGHHRLDLAKRLKVPIYYIVDNTAFDIFELEGQFGQVWTVADFARARAKDGNKACASVLALQKKYGLTLGAAASLLGGQSAGSGNKLKDIKKGTFEIAQDQSHKDLVLEIMGLCRTVGMTFATSSSFVKALSKVLRIPEINVQALVHKIKLLPALIRKRGTMDEYVEEIENLYNHGARVRVPIKYRAIEVAKERSAAKVRH